MMNRFLIILFSALLFVSCVGKKRQAKRTMDCPNPIVKLDELKQEIDLGKNTFEFLKMRSNLTITKDEKSFSLSAQIRVQNNKAIWISVKKLGFPVAKMKFTQDSVLIISPLEKQYFASNYKEASAFLKVEVGYDILQSAVLSEALWSEAFEELWHTNQDYVVSTHKKKLMQNFATEPNKIETKSTTQWVSCSTMILDQLHVFLPESSKSLWIKLSGPDSSAGFWMNTKMDLTVFNEDTKQQQIELEIKDIEKRSDLSLPLTIPDDYVPMQLY